MIHFVLHLIYYNRKDGKKRKKKEQEKFCK